MPVITLYGTPNVRNRHFTSFPLPMKGTQLAPDDFGGVRVHLQNDFAARGKDELGLQPPVEISQRDMYNFESILSLGVFWYTAKDLDYTKK